MTTIDPCDLEEDACQGSLENAFYGNGINIPQPKDPLSNLPQDTVTGNDSITMVSQDAYDANNSATACVEPLSTIDDETKLFCAPGSDVNSPRGIVSPSGEMSSPFSAMESDGEENGVDEANLSYAGDQGPVRRSNGIFGTSTPREYTTTPCPSSSACDDDYESTGSRKKRRKTKRDLHPYMNGPPIRFPRSVNQDGSPHDPDTSPFSPPTCPKGMSFNFAENNSRRSSNGVNTSFLQDEEYPAENAKRTRTCEGIENGDDTTVNIKAEVSTTMETSAARLKPAVRKQYKSARNSAALEEEQILHRQFQRKVENYELRVVAQPETQHRARYLTEGSRGPVKDVTQQGFPKVELLGSNVPAVLQVFVATDSGKIRPHGFYQACKVTGRNTSPCEETEIEGTKVIEIPFKPEAGEMSLSVDCVGILKLRNTDVEVRTGLRNQKRNQSVRLAFRANLRVPTARGERVLTVQTASSRISCTQPLGQPEISKKSSDRCSVEGGLEMFIIGKNFHRGTKVIYQDPEEPDGKQWSAEGDVDKDTFHQSHMVVRVPPYHDQSIVKPVNVQLLVEFQDKRCEPHSFTYTPRPKEPEQPKKETVPGNGSASNIASALSLFDGPIDKKFLVALFSKLLTAETPATREPQEQPKLDAPPQQQPPPNPAVLTSPQAIVNPPPVLQNMPQPQSVTTAASTDIKNNVCVVQPSPPLLNTSNASRFPSQPCNLPLTRVANQGMPIQPAIFSPVTSQTKFTCPTTDNTVPAHVQVKSEIPETLSNKSVLSSLQANVALPTTSHQTIPLSFPPSSASENQVVYVPQQQNVVPQQQNVVPPPVINPVSFQNSQPSLSEGHLFGAFCTPHSVSVQVDSNLPSATASVITSTMTQGQSVFVNVINSLPSQTVFGSQNILQQTAVFGSQNIQQQANFDASSGMMSSPTSNVQEQTAPMRNFQELPKQNNSQDIFTNTNDQPTITPVSTPSIRLQDVSSAMGLGQSESPLAGVQNVPMQFCAGQAPLPQSMLQQENRSFQNSLGDKEGSPVVQLIAVQNASKDLILNANQSGLNGPPQQIFSMTDQGQPMQIHTQMSDQGQQAFSLSSLPSNAVLQRPQPSHIQMVPVQSQNYDNATNGSCKTSNQGIQMHVDDPFIENVNTIKIPSQSNDVPQNGNYGVQSMTRITTVPEVQEMEDVTHLQPDSQPMDLQMKEVLVSPQQQQMFEQMQHQNTNTATSHNPMVTQSYHSQLSSNPETVSMAMQQSTASALTAQNFQNLQQPGQQNYPTSQATTSNMSFQLNVTPVSMATQIFQSQEPGSQGPPHNTAPIQTQLYQSPDSVTKSPPMMPSPAAAQHGFQSLPPQSQGIPMQNKALASENQLLDLPSQSLSPQNQQMSPGNSAQAQITNNFIYQGSNGAVLQHQSTNASHNGSVHISQAHNQNMTLNRPMVPHSPDIYAMTKLLQSIDGSENLEAISREDVQRHCQ